MTDNIPDKVIDELAKTIYVNLMQKNNDCDYENLCGVEQSAIRSVANIGLLNALKQIGG